MRGFEIFEENEDKFQTAAKVLIEKGSVSFEFMGKRVILTTYGLSYNLGFNFETENLDGTKRFLDGLCYYPKDYEDRIQTIATTVSILAAKIESAASVR